MSFARAAYAAQKTRPARSGGSSSRPVRADMTERAPARRGAGARPVCRLPDLRGRVGGGPPRQDGVAAERRLDLSDGETDAEAAQQGSQGGPRSRVQRGACHVESRCLVPIRRLPTARAIRLLRSSAATPCGRRGRLARDSAVPRRRRWLRRQRPRPSAVASAALAQAAETHSRAADRCCKPHALKPSRSSSLPF